MSKKPPVIILSDEEGDSGDDVKTQTQQQQENQQSEKKRRLFRRITFFIEGPFQGQTTASIVRMIEEHGGKVTKRVDHGMPSHIIISGHLWHREHTPSASQLIKNIKEANKETRASNKPEGAESDSDDDTERERQDERKYDFERVEKARKTALKKGRRTLPEVERLTAPITFPNLNNKQGPLQEGFKFQGGKRVRNEETEQQPNAKQSKTDEAATPNATETPIETMRDQAQKSPGKENAPFDTAVDKNARAADADQDRTEPARKGDDNPNKDPQEYIDRTVVLLSQYNNLESNLLLSMGLELGRKTDGKTKEQSHLKDKEFEHTKMNDVMDDQASSSKA
ncbi:hypothetical protein OIO90_000775 [Microbotryomycetes sp. JL221]|nr:hypothetical protein OIO90_000775 [Microbotryomycetes sp. JL221]